MPESNKKKQPIFNTKWQLIVVIILLVLTCLIVKEQGNKKEKNYSSIEASTYKKHKYMQQREGKQRYAMRISIPPNIDQNNDATALIDEHPLLFLGFILSLGSIAYIAMGVENKEEK